MTVVLGENIVFNGNENDDWLAFLGNGAVARGGDGEDWLKSNLSSSSLGSNLTAELYGGAGSDRLDATMNLEPLMESGNTERSLSATLEGGAGDDAIWVDFMAYSAKEVAVVSGDDGNDTIGVFLEGEDILPTSASVNGGYGNDQINVQIRIWGSSDEFNKSPSDTSIDAGIGDDIITFQIYSIAYGVNTSIDGGEGNDRIESISDTSALDGAESINTVSGSSGNDQLSLEATSYSGIAKNIAWGGQDSDTIDAKSNQLNELHGGSGSDNISAILHSFAIPEYNYYPDHGANIIYGDGGDDRLSAKIIVDDAPDGDFHSELYGGAGNDRLSVKGGEGNVLNGGAGNDTLIGGSGSDTLIGLQGDDALQGKGGADIFLFGFIRSGERDRIADFVIGEDVIDLSQIDANRDRAGEQSFRFGTREGTGRAWIEEDPDSTGSILYADDGHRVLEVLLKDGRAVSADDYSASDFLL